MSQKGFQRVKVRECGGRGLSVREATRLLHGGEPPGELASR